MPIKNVVDSCGWLEFFTDGANANFFAEPLSETENLVVPSICIYEVSKVFLREGDKAGAIKAIAHMRCAQVEMLDEHIAANAAELALEFKLAMADAIVLATANKVAGAVWTQDIDFKSIKNVRYISK